MIIMAAVFIILAVWVLPWMRLRLWFAAFTLWLGAGTYRALPAVVRRQIDGAAKLTQLEPVVLHYQLGWSSVGGLSAVTGLLLGIPPVAWAGAVVAVLALLKLINVHRAGRARLQSMINALPAQLDLLAMLLAAGQPLLSSLQRSSEGLLENPLRSELRAMVAGIRAGESMEMGLQRFAEAFNAREIRLFFGALNHARESGASLADILREQARHRRNELFLQAEQKALEAPVKLMLPLLTCIFPTALILLVVVLSAKLMWQL